MRAKLIPAGDVRVGDVVLRARGQEKVTGIAFQSEKRIELAYADGRFSVYNVETELHVWPGGKQ